MDGPVACAASSLVTTHCAPYWATTIQDQLGGVCTYEAGIEDAGPVADSGRPGASTSPAKSAGGGCSASTTESARAPAAIGMAALTALLTVAVRRRRKD